MRFLVVVDSPYKINAMSLDYIAAAKTNDMKNHAIRMYVSVGFQRYHLIIA